MAHAESCNNSIRCATLDEFVIRKLLEVLSPAGVDLSLQVIEDEQTRREQLDTLYAHRVEQTRYAVDLADRRYKDVDPANRLVASRLEGNGKRHLRNFRRPRPNSINCGTPAYQAQ